MQIGAMPRRVLIVFDLDGTVSDSRKLARECYKHVFAVLGYGEISDEQADAFNGPDADEICRVMGVGPDKRPLYDELIDKTAVDLVYKVGKMFPGVERMLEILSPYAIMAILTNGSNRYCEACIEAFGISPYIALHSGYVRGVSKASRIGIWERECGARMVICVGDRGTDIVNARKAGAVAVGVTYGMGSREELIKADYLCDTPEEVARVCKRLITF